MLQNKNIKEAHSGDYIKIGRMKGDISVGNKIYKMSDNLLTTSALNTLNQELRKIDLSCEMNVNLNSPLSLKIYNNIICVEVVSDIFPEIAIKSPITEDRLISQLCKTNNTPYNLKNIKINLGENLYVPSIAGINELRRQALSKFEEKLISSFKRSLSTNFSIDNSSKIHSQGKISLLLNTINLDYDYSLLNGVNRIYIPFKYFTMNNLAQMLNSICNNFDVYIYMPTIIRNSYHNLIEKNLDKILNSYKISGFVLSNIGNFELLKQYINYENYKFNENYKNYDFIANYTFNIFNNLTCNELPININTITLSPELNKNNINSFKTNKNIELTVYGNTPLMTTNYCLLGKTNKCYSSCEHKCNSSNKYYLKDRLGFLFRIIPDNIQTVTTIYNSKITSIESYNLPVDSVRIDILDENISEINSIIKTVHDGKKLEGNIYTNGNFNKEI